MMQCFFLFLLVIVLSSFVVAIEGTSSDGAVTAKNGGTSATATSGISSQEEVSGRVAVGGSGIAASYLTGFVTGSSGPDMTLQDAVTPPAETPAEETTEESGSIPSAGGGAGGGGGGSDGSGDSGAESGESAESEGSAESESAESSSSTFAESGESADAEGNAEASSEAVSVAVELSDGSSLSLSPETGASEMTVVEVTETTATIIVETESSTETSSNELTGGVVAAVKEETTLHVGESVEVDTDGDGSIDLKITLTKIMYDEEAKKYRALFTTTYLHPNEDVLAYVENQASQGKVVLVETPQEVRTLEPWTLIVLGLFILFCLFIIIHSLYEKKKKTHSMERGAAKEEKHKSLWKISPRLSHQHISARPVIPLFSLPTSTKSGSAKIGKVKKRKKRRSKKKMKIKRNTKKQRKKK